MVSICFSLVPFVEVLNQGLLIEYLCVLHYKVPTINNGIPACCEECVFRVRILDRELGLKDGKLRCLRSG